MRFSLRNQNKIVDSFGDRYLSLLIDSLTDYFSKHKEIEERQVENNPHKFIFVPNIQPKTDSEFQFVIISKTFDVYNLAYYSAIG